MKSYLKKLQWLPVTERIKFKTLNMIHKSLITKNPQYINSLFTINEINNTTQTRQSNTYNLKIARPISEIHRRAPSIYGPVV